MKWSVLFPGKIKPKALVTAEEEYTRRLTRYGAEVLLYRDERVGARNPEEVKRLEAKRILAQLKPHDYLVACDERGKAVRTEEIARLLQAARQGSHPLQGRSRLVFVVGGALGLDETVRQRADAVWALSGLVLAGGVARIVLLEALYRAQTLIDGHPYHNN